MCFIYLQALQLDSLIAVFVSANELPLAIEDLLLYTPPHADFTLLQTTFQQRFFVSTLMDSGEKSKKNNKNI